MRTKYAAVYYPANSGSQIVAGARIARWLHALLERSELYDAVLLVDGKTIKDITLGNIPFTLFMVNVPKVMVSDVPRTEEWVRKATEVVWIQNDFSIWAPNPDMQCESIVYVAFMDRLRKGRPAHVWSTCRDRCERWAGHYTYCNWNALAFTPLSNPPPSSARFSKLLYWGAPREGREAMFAKYLSGAEVVISTTDRGREKFSAMIKEPFEGALKFMGPIFIPNDVAQYRSTIYIEDKQSSKAFHSLANRFYEALSARTALFVAEEAVGTFAKAGIDVRRDCPDCIVRDGHEAYRRFAQAGAIANTQLRWHKDPAHKTLNHAEALARHVYSLVKEL